MSTEADKRNTELTRKTNGEAQQFFTRQNPNEPVEAAEHSGKDLSESLHAKHKGKSGRPEPA